MRLSDRELQIARLAASGLGRSEIARNLYLSPHTVKRHLRAARSKLGVADPTSDVLLRRRLQQLGLADDDHDGDTPHQHTER